MTFSGPGKSCKPAHTDSAVPTRNEAHFADFEAGRTRLQENPPSRVLAWAEAIRRTDFYRDLPLRTVLSEATRKRLFDRLGARLERRRK